MSDYVSKAKPYIWGAIVGVIATLAVAFGSGWAVTADTMQNKVAQAEVRVLANVCENKTESYWTAQGKKIEALEGYDNKKRAQLVERFAPELKSVQMSAVTERCGDLVNPGAF